MGATTGDLDGDGMADSAQACVGIPPSGQDYDQDGIDDACDGFIDSPPVPTPSAQTSTDPISNIFLASTSSTSQSSTANTGISYDSFYSTPGKVLSATTEKSESAKPEKPLLKIAVISVSFTTVLGLAWKFLPD